jgi:hypothetical protein
MRKMYYTLAALLFLAACSKKNDTATPPDNGPIAQIKVDYSTISPADKSTANNLLQQNKITHNGEAFIRFSTTDLIAGGGIYQFIISKQSFNELPILSSYIEYTFKDGTFQKIAGPKYKAINQDNQPKSSLQYLRSSYMSTLKSKDAALAAKFKDSSLVAELGYYDLNYNTSNPSNTDVNKPNFIKVWRVTPKGAIVPVALFRDDTGQKIEFILAFTD